MLGIDAIILLLFLLTNLLVGLHYGRGVRTFKTYATGDGNFSTIAVIATIVATWISGGIFAFNLSGVYTEGLPFILIMFGMPIALAIIGVIYIPRMGEFMHSTSLSHAMGILYGRHVRYISAICGIWLSAGVVALQIKLLSNLLEWNFGINDSYITATLATSIIVAYSAFGGIRSVTITDIVQAITFSALIPSLCIVLWHIIDTPENVKTLIASDPKFSFDNILKFKWIGLFIWSAVPWLAAPTFQRILIAKNLLQARRTFIIASIIAFIIIALTSWIAILLLASNANLDAEKLIMHLLEDYSFPGLRGLILAGIAAMVMGSADSYIHSAAVQFANDLPNFAMDPTDSEKLWKSRLFAVVIGVVGLCLSLSQHNLLDLALLVTNFYLPIVTAPLTLAILGFRTSSITILTGMFTGGMTAGIWLMFFSDSTEIDSAAPGMLVNFITTLAFHYITNQPGGWRRGEHTSMLNTIRMTRKYKHAQFLGKLCNFNLWTFLNSSTPNVTTPYVQFGFFSLISIFANMYALRQTTQILYSGVLELSYNITLLISGIFLLYPLWNKHFHKIKLRGLIWHLAIFINLVCFGGFVLIISHFSQFSTLIFTINLLVVCMLIRWEAALPMVCLGSITNYFIYEQFINTTDAIATGFADNAQLKILYCLLLFASLLIAFIKPKQDSETKLQDIARELETKAATLTEEARKALEVKMDFINNMNHEVRTPIQGVSSMAANLMDNWDKLSEAQRKDIARILDQNAQRFVTLIDSILNFSELASNKFQMHYQEHSVKQLLIKTLEHCKRYYLSGKNTLCELTMEDDDAILNCDSRYISLLFVNLIANAMKYSPDGVIEINVSKSHKRDEMGNEDPHSPAIQIAIKDSGIGIPDGEQYSIFLPFTLSSYTDNKSGGRGIGLALSQLIVRQHGGSIWAENNPDGKGATFYVRI